MLIAWGKQKTVRIGVISLCLFGLAACGGSGGTTSEDPSASADDPSTSSPITTPGSTVENSVGSGDGSSTGGTSGGGTTGTSSGGSGGGTTGTSSGGSTGGTIGTTTGTTTGGVAGSVAEPFAVGVFSGGADPQSAATFESWLGRRSDFNVDFLADQGYTGDNSLPISAAYTVSKWSAANRPDRNLLISVPLATVADNSLIDVALGNYDAEFLQTARTIAQSYPNAIIRLGWEFNGNYNPWSAVGRASDYIAAFRRIAQIFKSVSPTFRIDWCPNLGANSMPAEQAYPGDDVVDVIGMDVYDNWNYSTQVTDPAARWKYIMTEDHGLAWQQAFSSSHGKPMSFPEWSVNHDDPYFAQIAYQWFTSNNFAYVSYWDSNSGFEGELDDGQYPNLSQAYRTLFGALTPQH